MKNKALLIIILIVFLIAPYLGVSAKNENKPTGKKLVTTTPAPSDTVTPTKTPCDPNKEWKNHGEYVSCVARFIKDPEAVRIAAQSDVGKKNTDREGENLTPAPTSNLTATPTPLPTQTSVTGTPTPTFTPTSTPTPGSILTVTANSRNQFAKLIEKLESFLKSLVK